MVPRVLNYVVNHRPVKQLAWVGYRIPISSVKDASPQDMDLMLEDTIMPRCLESLRRTGTTRRTCARRVRNPDSDPVPRQLLRKIA